jgi:hypothetical protein
VNQRLANGLSVGPSPFNPARTTSTIVTQGGRLDVDGTGAGRGFRIGAGQTLVKSGTAELNVRNSQSHGPNSTLAVNEGTVNFSTDAGAPAQNNLSINVSGGSTVNFATSQHLGKISLATGAIKLAAASPAGSRLIDATDFSITGGQLDLANGRLIIDYTPGNSPHQAIRAAVAMAFDPASPTHWTGQGITSSIAAGESGTGVGYAESSDVLGVAGGVFGPEAVDGSAVLVRYTKLGDANLDGTVDFNDLSRLAQNYNRTDGTIPWSGGDFNYDGNVDFNDLSALAQNYNTALPAGAGAIPAMPLAADFSEDLAKAFAEVPEPTTLSLLAIAAGFSLAPRRRRCR